MVSACDVDGRGRCHMSELWVLIPLSAFASVTYVIHAVIDGFRRRQQLRLTTEFHGKLLDRIGSAHEFGEFLNTSGGAKFLASLTTESEAGGTAARILRAVQGGLVFLALGVGLFVLVDSRNLPFEAKEGMATFATITTSVGIGLLLSAAASFFLSRHLGLIDAKSGRSTDTARSA